MKKKLLSLATLHSVEIFEKKRCKKLVYRPHGKFLWWEFPEGFCTEYDSYSTTDFYTREELMNGKYKLIPMLIEDNKVYYKPYVKLIFQREKDEFKYFETYDEAKDWVDRIIEFTKFVNI